MKIVSKRSSFTLFELLIVILIISILYGIFVEKISSKKHLLQSKGLYNIRSILEPFDFNESIKIVCIDRCKHCFIKKDGKKEEEIEFFKKEVEVYDFDIHGILSQIRFAPIFDKEGNPKDVCFEYELKKNGSNSSYVVKYDNKFYIFFAYMQPVQIASSLTEASEIYESTQWVPTETSEYNF